jgi:Tol biopolymer transport system component
MTGNSPHAGEYRITIRSLESGEEKILTTGPMAEELSDPSWSPDGRTIVCVVSHPEGALSGLVAVDPESGKRNPVTTAKKLLLDLPLWLPDGKGLLVLGHLPYFAQSQIFFVSLPDGKLTPVTRDTSSYVDLSLSTDGHTAAAVVRQVHLSQSVMAVGSSQGQPFGAGSYNDMVSWTRDGKLLISAAAGGLTLANLESGSQTPFASQVPGPNFARACADGHVVFSSRDPQENELRVFFATADGSSAKQLTTGKLDSFPACAPDGKTVLYSDANGALQKVSTEGGSPQKASDDPVFSRITISPDGKLAAFSTVHQGNNAKENLALLSLDTSQPPRFLEFERPRADFFFSYTASALAFSADGKGIVYPTRNGETDNLWLQNLDGSPGRQLTDFKSEFIRDFDYSFDGKRLAIIRGHQESDVVLIRDSEK